MRRMALLALVAGVTFVACSDDDGPALSVDDLDGEACPVDLDDVTGVEREVGVEGEDTVLADYDGIYVECSGTVSGETVTVAVMALQRDDLPPSQALLQTFPHLARVLELSTDDLQAIADDLDDPPSMGEAVELGVDGPAAVARVAVDGASSAALLVIADDAEVGAGPIVESLADDLAS